MNKHLTDLAAIQDAEGFQRAFEDALSDKVASALEDRKVHVAQNFFSDVNYIQNEEVEQIDEISQATKNDYIDKAKNRIYNPASTNTSPQKAAKLQAGITRAEKGTSHVVLVHKAHTGNLQKTVDALKQSHGGDGQHPITVHQPSGKYGPDHAEIHIPRSSPTGRNIESVKHTLSRANDGKPVTAAVVHGDSGEMHRIGEGVEQIHELSKSTLAKYVSKASDMAMSHGVALGSARVAGAINPKEPAWKDIRKYHDNKITKRMAGVKVAAKKLAGEEDVNERTMEPEEMDKREKIVKGMKKSVEGFRKRYGSRAKEVMYATATKLAKD